MTAAVQAFPVRAHLLPFVTRALYRGPAERHQPTRWPVPVADLDLYTSDDLDALRAILPQGLLYAFAHRAQGWRARDLLLGREAWASQRATRRLWGAASELTFAFGPQSLALLESLYNLSARRSATGKAQGYTRTQEVKRLCTLDLSSDSDQALTYWMLDALWPQFEARMDSDEKEAPAWQSLRDHLCATQPMMALRLGPWAASPLPTIPDIEASLKTPARALMPWWLRHALLGWQEREASLWSLPPADFIRVRQRQSALLRTWTEAISKSQWLHLLPPLLDYFEVQERWLTALSRSDRPASLPSEAWQSVRDKERPAPAALAEAGLARLNRAYRGLRNQDRQELREAWADTLIATRLLFEACRARASIHHADREQHDVYLVDWAAQSRVDEVTCRLEATGHAIEGRLG